MEVAICFLHELENTELLQAPEALVLIMHKSSKWLQIAAGLVDRDVAV